MWHKSIREIRKNIRTLSIKIREWIKILVVQTKMCKQNMFHSHLCAQTRSKGPLSCHIISKAYVKVWEKCSRSNNVLLLLVIFFENLQQIGERNKLIGYIGEHVPQPLSSCRTRFKTSESAWGHVAVNLWVDTSTSMTNK